MGAASSPGKVSSRFVAAEEVVAPGLLSGAPANGGCDHAA
jgi:hypothetical protein